MPRYENSPNDSDTEDEELYHKKVKVLSNKTIDPKSIPAKPTTLTSNTATIKPFDFRLTFTNGQLLCKFLEPVQHSVQKMKFILKKSPTFMGFKMEAHDAYMTLANKSVFECDIQGNESIFCVSATSFMQALSASTLKDTTLTITKYHESPDIVTFEAENNESDVRTTYTCALIENSQVNSLDALSFNLGFHVNVHYSILKNLSLNAKKCGASTLLFDLLQAQDPDDDSIFHSKLTIGFQGIDTSGSHEFQISAKKTFKEIDNKSVVSWTPLPKATAIANMKQCCHSEYDNNKLRVFLNHMECSWVLVHLGNDNTEQPLVLEFILGSLNTKHCVIIAPRTPD